MIKKLKLTNFKLFNAHEIDFKPITILAGANGAGKSSVIQSLLLAKRAMEVDETNKKDVSLNGPYLLKLGIVKDVISANASSEEIHIEVCGEDGETKIKFDMDLDRAPTLLNISSLNTTSNNSFNDILFIYLNAERIGPRVALEMNASFDLELGFQGEFTNYVIHQADILNISIHEDLLIPGVPSSFPKQVEAWFRTIIPEIEFNLTANFDVGMVVIKYKNKSDSDFYIPTATGFGISYALPIVVAGLLASAKPSSILIVENPEAHLHPFGQSRIAKFLALLSTVGVQVIVETHSEHVINGARLQLARVKQTENLKINFFSQGLSNIVPIDINKLGELSSWPIGFFDQQQEDLRELLRLKKSEN